MILEVSWDGFWTLPFGLSQFHGHNSWLVCEVALGVHPPHQSSEIINLLVSEDQLTKLGFMVATLGSAHTIWLGELAHL